MKLGFRVDSNQFSGYGHFSRMLNLARSISMYSEVYEIEFVGNFNQFASTLLKQYSIKHVPVVGKKYELDLDALDKYKAVFYDSYFIDQNILSSISDMSNLKFALADECNYDYTGIDGVINFRVDAEKIYQYSARNNFIGVDYFIVKPELTNVRKENWNVSPTDIKSLLLFMGGQFTEINIISQLIKTVNTTIPGAEVLYLNDNNIELKDCRYQNIASTYEIENLIQKADAMVNGGGLIKYEAAYALVPTASLSTSALQFEDSVLLDKNSLLCNLGLWSSDGMESVIMKLNHFLRSTDYRTELYSSCKLKFSDNPTRQLVESLIQLLN